MSEKIRPPGVDYELPEVDVPPRVPATEAAFASARAYTPHPDEGAMLAARLYDGQARTPWEAVPDDTPENRAREQWVTDADLIAGGEIVRTIVEAFAAGDREVLARLDSARRLLLGVPQLNDRQGRLAAFVVAMERLAWRVRQVDRRDRDGRRQLHYLARHALAEHHDAAFATLAPEHVGTALERLVDARSGGGRGKRGAIGTAAALAVDAGAFGFVLRRGESKRGLLVRAQEQLRKAPKRAKEHVF